MGTARLHLAGIWLAALVSISCGGRAVSQTAGAQQPAPTVVTAEAVKRTVPLYREYVGRTEANLSVDIRPQVAGVLLDAPFAQGAPVKQGDILFRIDPSQYQAALQSAQSQLARAEADVQQSNAQLGKAQQDVARYAPLAAQRAIPQQDYENAVAAERVAVAQVQQANASVETARAAVQQANLNLGYAVIRSPITGIIGRREVDPGNLVAPGNANPLATVSSADPIRVTFDISDVEYLQFVRRTGVRPGKPPAVQPSYELLLPDGTVFPQRGKLFMVGRAVTAATGTLPITAEFPNPGNVLRPGQFARVRVTVENIPNAILVPQTAVQEVLGTMSVLIVDNQNKVEQRTVSTNGTLEGSYIVNSGLAGGERVIVQGQQKVRPGMKVVPEASGAKG